MAEIRDSNSLGSIVFYELTFIIVLIIFGSSYNPVLIQFIYPGCVTSLKTVSELSIFPKIGQIILPVCSTVFSASPRFHYV